MHIPANVHPPDQLNISQELLLNGNCNKLVLKVWIEVATI